MRPDTLAGRPFLKMHGLGNDFIVLDEREQPVTLTGDVVRRLADRHFGIGCDQLVLLGPPQQGGDVRMRIWNADGGEVEACGNATRCVARVLLADSGRRSVVIETGAGALTCEEVANGLIAVDMGAPEFDWQRIPIAHAVDTRAFPFAHHGLACPSAVNVGNPHLVFFVSDCEAYDLARLGPEIEHDPLFPARINVSLARIDGPAHMTLRVWERGAGLTRACGTAACAALVCAARRGLCGRQAEIVLPGGSLFVEWRESDNRIVMSGPAALVCSGEIGPDLVPAEHATEAVPERGAA